MNTHDSHDSQQNFVLIQPRMSPPKICKILLILLTQEREIHAPGSRRSGPTGGTGGILPPKSKTRRTRGALGRGRVEATRLDGAQFQFLNQAIELMNFPLRDLMTWSANPVLGMSS